uniref:Uncharacterized protein n=1 Tax=Oncorhynchus mykiss TaxID=8022 RepID=A0A8C7U0Q6_ONCMY
MVASQMAPYSLHCALLLTRTFNQLKKGNKNGKGLSHFSMKACAKVQKKGNTSYNEVADELVAEFTHSTTVMTTDSQVYDQKNIRRRIENVYVRINVFEVCIDKISCSNNVFKTVWIGVFESLHFRTNGRLMEHRRQKISFKNLVQRNKASEASSLALPPSSSVIQLPFIFLNTDVRTVIDCSTSSDKYVSPQCLHPHKRMGLSLDLESGKCTADNLVLAKSLIPRSLEIYIIGERGVTATVAPPSLSLEARCPAPSGCGL